MPAFMVSVLVVLLFGCSAAPADPPDLTPVTQPVDKPAGVDTLQGLDMTRLRALVARIREGTSYPDMHSLLVMRHGELVLEEYFPGGSAETPHTMQSVSKSVASAIIGMALDEGILQGWDERVLDFFPQWKDDLGMDEARAAMRIEDILTMRTGTDYHENGPDSPHSQLNRLPTGWDRFWLERPMTHQPGTHWQYDSGGVIALSSLLAARTGAHADVFAQSRLFAPLGFRGTSWFRNQEGHPHLGGGLQLRSIDMLGFGQLYLQRGSWNGDQVVPRAWVDSSFVQRVTFSPPQGPNGVITGYGYLWWILAADPAGNGDRPIHAAMGYRGQYVFIVPEHEMVVAVTGWMPENMSTRPIAFLYSDILPAVVR